jgi:transaldolase
LKILIASVIPDQIEIARNYGIHGIATNPTVLKEANLPWRDAVSKSAKLCQGPYHLQVTENECDGIVRQAYEFAELLGNRLVLKICITPEGLAAMKVLKSEGFLVNLTGIVSPLQAVIGVQAGADFVSVYVGRSNVDGIDGIAAIRNLGEYIRLHEYSTQIVAASIKEPFQMWQAGLAGAHLVACPFPTLVQSIQHPVTSASIKKLF